MSLSPGFPQGAPTLAEVLLARTFAKPPQPFVDGEFLETLAHADDEKPAVTVQISQPAAAGDSSDSSSADTGGGAAADRGASTPTSVAADAGRSVDVRV